MKRTTRSVESCTLPSNFIAVIAEKPKAAQRIASALGEPTLCYHETVPYWIVKNPEKPIVVLSAAGHLFGLHTSYKEKYPVYEFEWKPLWVISRDSQYTKKFYDLLARVLPKASLYVSACDYDIEGSVICFKVIEAFGDPRRTLRMKFSTLTAVELRNAFRNLQPLDTEMIEAGLARHELDWLWGINVSRALMDSLRSVSGLKRILSAGRVQSPTLYEAARRWLARALHVPQPHISITVVAETRDKRRLTFKLLVEKIDSIIEAKNLSSDIKRQKVLLVSRVERSEKRIHPPPAFNLGDLQHEAYRLYGFSPMKTQEIAEELYLRALISYPRTNSQKLPPTIDFHKIMAGLRSNPTYSKLIDLLIRETGGALKPVQGKEDDPAHPAIHPTGEMPRSLTKEQQLIYDLIVRRFLSAFSKPAIIGDIEVFARDRAGRHYVARGEEVVEEGWLRYYPFYDLSRSKVPPVKTGDELVIVNVKTNIRWDISKETITKDSLLRWMESVGLGTESTRARIIETLYDREYIVARGRTAIVTDLGLAVVSVLEEYVPELVSPELTRRFEKLLNDIRLKRTTRTAVVREAISTIDMIIEKIVKNKEKIGKSLAESMNLTKPTEKCIICGRQASAKIHELQLCRYHVLSYEMLAKSLPEISRKLALDCREALELIAGKKVTGPWILELAKFLLRNPQIAETMVSEWCNRGKGFYSLTR